MKILLTAVAVLMLVGCDAIQPIVVALDKIGDATVANNRCQLRAAQEHRDVCGLVSPATEVEATFISAFEANPTCAGVELRIYDPKSDDFVKNRWILSFDVDMPYGGDGLVDVAKSGWHISGHRQLADGGIGDAVQASTNVCRIVKGLGGTVRQ